MFGENFKSMLGIKNNSHEEELPKGSQQNPYSQAEFNSLAKERMRKEQLVHFDGYVNDTTSPKNPNVRYLNFVEKDSNFYTVNLSPSQKRTYTRLNTIKNEDNSFSNNVSVLVKDGGIMKKMTIRIGYELPLSIRKEIVDTVYRKINSEDFASNRTKWSEEAKKIKEEECRKDLLWTVAGIVRKNIEDSEDDSLDIQIL